MDFSQGRDYTGFRIRTHASPLNVTDQICRSAGVLNKVSGKEIFVPTSFFSLESSVVSRWAQDLLALKNIICTLPERLGLNTARYADLFGFAGYGCKYLRHHSPDWASSFFRPDCILTKDGLKVLEFNIDTGSMSLIAGLWQLEFYANIKGFDSHMLCDHKASLRRSFFSPDLFLKYLQKKHLSGKSIYCWDLAGRSAEVRSRRNSELAFFKRKGVDVKLLEGKEILNITGSGSYCFRYFAYPHFFNKNLKMLDVYSAIPRDFVSRNDISISSAFYDSKVNMALLWSPMVQKHLSVGEVRLVEKYIPRTIKASEIVNAREEFVRKKNKWAIKLGTGFQGNGVHIGREHEQKEWKKILDGVLRRRDAVLQEFCACIPLPITFTNGQKTIHPHGAHILNIYYVDNCFGGLTLRIGRSNQNAKIGPMDLQYTLAALPLILAER